MDVNALIEMLTEGLDSEQAAIVRKAVERDSVKTKASGLKQQSEYDAIAAKQAQLEAELNGANGQPGSKKYQEWYEKNFPEIQKLQERAAAYEAKYGTLEAPKEPVVNQQQTGLSEADIQRLVDQRIQTGYAPQWSELLTGTGQIVQKHMFAGRKQPIDFKQLAKIAAEKTNGNLEAAYDEWDRPEREKAEAADRENEIKRRVNEEIQKRGASQYFPAGADASPGALSVHKGSTDKFDKAAMMRDLASTYMTAGDASTTTH